MTERYAIYFAPDADSELWARASSWLGRDAATNLPVTRPQTELEIGFVDALTSKAAGYGFHGTLLAPFSLSAGASVDQLCTDLASFAAAQNTFELMLEVTSLGSFIALCPTSHSCDLVDLHTDLVKTFTSYCAPLKASDLDRRSKAGRLTDRQMAYLHKWGYPFIFEDFRFHMTLTKSVAEEDRSNVLNVVHDLFDDLLQHPVAVSSVALFHQPSRDKPFSIQQHFPFGR